MSQIHIDCRVFIGFMIVMMVMNAIVLFADWDQIRTGMSDFPNFYSNAQMIRDGEAASFTDSGVLNSFVRRVGDLPRAPFNHLPCELLMAICTWIHPRSCCGHRAVHLGGRFHGMADYARILVAQGTGEVRERA